MTLDANQFTWHGNRGSAEHSDLERTRLAWALEVKGKKQTLLFLYVAEIFHGEREDRELAGWNYSTKDGVFHLTIWND